MSAIVIGTTTVDPRKVQRLWSERRADFEAVVADAKTQGAVHHRWGFGDGRVVIIDERKDGESFQRFFQPQQTIAELLAAAAVEDPADFQIYEAKEGPDHF